MQSGQSIYLQSINYKPVGGYKPLHNTNNMNNQTINPGETLLTVVKAVRGGKLQLEFAEIIKNPSAKSGNSLVGLLNASDDRFSTPKSRKAWISGERADIERSLGMKVGDLAEGEEKVLNILNPEIAGERVRIQVTETTEGSEYQKANYETSAKRAGAGGAFITYGGKYIFSNTAPIIGKAVHTFLPADVVEVAVASDISEDHLEA